MNHELSFGLILVIIRTAMNNHEDLLSYQYCIEISRNDYTVRSESAVQERQNAKTERKMEQRKLL